jgi:hypothetical protein
MEERATKGKSSRNVDGVLSSQHQATDAYSENPQVGQTAIAGEL